MSESEWPEIRANTLIEEIQRIHKDIWQYAIEYGEKPETPYIHNCAACEYAFYKAHSKYYCVVPNREIRCLFCPIEWPDNLDCHSKDGLYSRWLIESDIDDDSEETKEVACQIKNLPFKKGK